MARRSGGGMMPTVICPNNMCLYNDDFKGICTYDGCIHAEEECEVFKSYREEAEYQEEYWMACEAHGKKYRTQHYGKCIKVKGLILYTQDRLPPQELWDDPKCGIHCTEKQTGLGLSLHNVFNPESYECILKYMREFPNVMDLPLRDGVEVSE
jgi:hypothetical protein